MSNFLWVLASAILRGRLPRTLLATTLVSITLLSAQETRPVPTPITRDEVWQAVTLELRQRGVREEQLLGLDEIDLPGVIPAAASRTLKVSMVCWDAERGRAQFQLECREPGQCVPFLAYADAGRSTAMGSEKIGGSFVPQLPPALCSLFDPQSDHSPWRPCHGALSRQPAQPDLARNLS